MLQVAPLSTSVLVCDLPKPFAHNESRRNRLLVREQRQRESKAAATVLDVLFLFLLGRLFNHQYTFLALAERAAVVVAANHIYITPGRDHRQLYAWFLLVIPVAPAVCFFFFHRFIANQLCGTFSAER